MSSLHNSYSLARSVWRVLSRTPRLLIYPIVSCVVLTLLTFVLIALVYILPAINQARFGLSIFKILLASLVVMIACVFCTTFCNSALVVASYKHMTAQRGELHGGFRSAFSRSPQLLIWTFIKAHVLLLLQVQSRTQPGSARVAYGVTDLTWDVATYLTLPVMMIRKTPL